jgi:hypothetical protein
MRRDPRFAPEVDILVERYDVFQNMVLFTGAYRSAWSVFVGLELVYQVFDREQAIQMARHQAATVNRPAWLKEGDHLQPIL